MSKKVLIVGGGFAGLSAASTLGSKPGVQVTLIDRRNHHLFQPLLYQVAMAGLSPAEIASPIRSLLTEHANVDVLLGNVQSVDLRTQKVTADFGELAYDYLILACGAKHSYFGHPEWEEHAPGLKTLEQATEIRRRVLLAFELAERETDPELRKKWQTFVVVGGGPTGVELAGAIGEMSRYTLTSDFSHIDSSRTRIMLIEAGPRVLASFSENLSGNAARELERLGVQVWTNSRVTNITTDGVQIGAEFVKAGTVLWAAGVQPSSLNKDLGTQLDPQGRAIVGEDLTLPNLKNVFVLGDQANAKDTDGKPLPGLGPVALQQGRFAARAILADLKNKPRGVFKYVDKGTMATIGRSAAVAQIKNLEVTGFLAWMMWLFIHVYFLIGFKNKFFVLLEWLWSYVSFKRGARLILYKDWRSYPKHGKPS